MSMPPELRGLMLRFIQLGGLLPQGDAIARDIALADARTRAEARLVVDEMRKVWAQIDAFIKDHGTR
jgi:hypothetical protein